MQKEQSINNVSSQSRSMVSQGVYASEKDLSDDVLDAGTLSRPLATSVRFFQVMALLDQYASK